MFVIYTYIRGSNNVVYANVHLEAVHKLVRGPDEFSKALADAVLYNPDDDLSRSLVDYGRVTQSISIHFLFCLFFFCLLLLLL